MAYGRSRRPTRGRKGKRKFRARRTGQRNVYQIAPRGNRKWRPVNKRYSKRTMQARARMSRMMTCCANENITYRGVIHGNDNIISNQDFALQSVLQDKCYYINLSEIVSFAIWNHLRMISGATTIIFPKKIDAFVHNVGVKLYFGNQLTSTVYQDAVTWRFMEFYARDNRSTFRNDNAGQARPLWTDLAATDIPGGGPITTPYNSIVFDGQGNNSYAVVGAADYLYGINAPINPNYALYCKQRRRVVRPTTNSGATSGVNGQFIDLNWKLNHNVRYESTLSDDNTGILTGINEGFIADASGFPVHTGLTKYLMVTASDVNSGPAVPLTSIPTLGRMRASFFVNLRLRI